MHAYVYVDGSYCHSTLYGCIVYYIVTRQGRYIFTQADYTPAYNFELWGTIRVLEHLHRFLPFISEVDIMTDYKPCQLIFENSHGLKARKTHKVLKKAIHNHPFKRISIQYIKGHVENPTWHDSNFRRVDQLARKIVKGERRKYAD